MYKNFLLISAMYNVMIWRVRIFCIGRVGT